MMGLLLVAILVVPSLFDRSTTPALRASGFLATAAAAPLIGPGRFARERLGEARA